MRILLLIPLLLLTSLLSAQTFSEKQQLPPIEDVRRGSIAFADVDGDRNPDLMIAGTDSANNEFVKLYINQGATISSIEREPDPNMKVSIYPNPVQVDNLTINCDLEANGRFFFKLFSSGGRLMTEASTYFNKGKNKFIMNMSSLPSGNYFLEVSHRDKRGTAKVLIQR